MYISPPIGVLAVLAVGLTGATWLAPPPPEAAQVTVTLPAATHQKLALWGKAHAGADGRPLTLVQVIEELMSGRQQDNEASTMQRGTPVR